MIQVMDEMKQLLILVTVAQLVAACGEFSYKRGASVRDLEQSKKLCAAAVDENAQLDCLREQGWSVTKLGNDNLFAHAKPSSGQLDAKPTKKPTKTLDASTSTPADSQQNQVSKMESSQAEGGETAAIKTVASTESKTVMVVDDPLQRFIIQSWWKFGAHGDALNNDMSSCTATLGDHHKPDVQKQSYTKMFAVCMYEKGWKGLVTEHQ
jgi:hypothetical protein